MRIPVPALAACALLAACATAASEGEGGRPPAPVAPGGAATAAGCAEAGAQVARTHRVAAIATRRFTHDELWAALRPALGSPALRVTEVGRSIQGRPIRAVTYGSGPTTVLLWSQMHGDESTATMSLADILAWLAAPTVEHEELRRRLATRLTVVMVPMLNPDGAELFQRQNAIGVDVNRDARRLATPEARALKGLRDSLRPAFGFNLHDQNARTLAGPGGRQVAIALLAPAADRERSYGPVRTVARQVAAEIATVLQGEIPGRMAKYDDTFEPRAFGDLMQQWGTSTVLIESGAMAGDPEKQRLRELNVVAILTALDAMATDRLGAVDVAAYESLPTNARVASDIVVRGGTLVLPGAPPMQVDLALVHDDPVAGVAPRVREVGDLASYAAMDTVDATGLFLHPDPSMLTERGGRRWLRIDAPVSLTIRRGPEPSSAEVRRIGDRAAAGGG